MNSEPIIITLFEKDLEKKYLEKLKTTLKKYPGDSSVVLRIRLSNSSYKSLELKAIKVKDTICLFNDLLDTI